MSENRDTLEDRLQDFGAKLGGLKSFVKELGHHVDKHGTPHEHVREDLLEAENNIKFYEAGIEDARARLAKLGDAPKPGAQGTSGGGNGVGIGPALKSKKGVGALILGLAAAALVAVGLKSRRGRKGDED